MNAAAATSALLAVACSAASVALLAITAGRGAPPAPSVTFVILRPGRGRRARDAYFDDLERSGPEACRAAGLLRTSFVSIAGSRLAAVDALEDLIGAHTSAELARHRTWRAAAAARRALGWALVGGGNSSSDGRRDDDDDAVVFPPVFVVNFDVPTSLARRALVYDARPAFAACALLAGPGTLVVARAGDSVRGGHAASGPFDLVRTTQRSAAEDPRVASRLLAAHGPRASTVVLVGDAGGAGDGTRGSAPNLLRALLGTDSVVQLRRPASRAAHAIALDLAGAVLS